MCSRVHLASLLRSLAVPPTWKVRMGPSRTHATTTFVDFAPDPLAGYESAVRKHGDAPNLGWRRTFPLRMGLTSHRQRAREASFIDLGCLGQLPDNTSRSWVCSPRRPPCSLLQQRLKGTSHRIPSGNGLTPRRGDIAVKDQLKKGGHHETVPHHRRRHRWRRAPALHPLTAPESTQPRSNRG